MDKLSEDFFKGYRKQTDIDFTAVCFEDKKTIRIFHIESMKGYSNIVIPI